MLLTFTKMIFNSCVEIIKHFVCLFWVFWYVTWKDSQLLNSYIQRDVFKVKTQWTQLYNDLLNQLHKEHNFIYFKKWILLTRFFLFLWNSSSIILYVSKEKIFSLILRLNFSHLLFIDLLPQAQKWIFSLNKIFFSFRLCLEILLFHKMTCWCFSFT